MSKPAPPHQHFPPRAKFLLTVQHDGLLLHFQRRQPLGLCLRRQRQIRKYATD